MPVTEDQPILIIEDSPEDFEMTAIALKKSGLVNPVYHCEDGDEALDYLYRKDKYADPDKSPKPGIVFLDLNLPGTDGREILHMLKNDDALKKIPVIVLTTSNDERDIQKCYEYGANGYVQKPVDLKKFIASIEQLKDYWFKIVVLPKYDDS